MNKNIYEERKAALEAEFNALVNRQNKPVLPGNGIFERYEYPILTAAHVPLDWRYDFNRKRNPYLMERLGINAVMNSGALYKDGKYYLACRVEGWDRKSFFAIAESDDGINNFRFHEFPCVIPETERPDTNTYDMRLTEHEDGWIYGVFCTERKDPDAPDGDTSSAQAKAGIVRTKDLKNWERLPDLETKSSQQRNVVLHPEFVGGKYFLYTRPQDGFIETGSGGGICWGLSDSMENASIETETLLDEKIYHTIKEVKNGAGAVPIKTDKGWLHIAHGVRNTAAGLRYVIYAFMTDLNDPGKLTYCPGGYLIAPEGEERIGDVSNVVFTNGAAVGPDGRVVIYYASSDTRMHAAETSIERLVDYCIHTPEDQFRSAASVNQRIELIKENRFLKQEGEASDF